MNLHFERIIGVIKSTVFESRISLIPGCRRVWCINIGEGMKASSEVNNDGFALLDEVVLKGISKVLVRDKLLGVLGSTDDVIDPLILIWLLCS